MESIEINPDDEYGRALERSHLIDSIISLNRSFSREYLSMLTTDELENLEDSLLCSSPEALLRSRNDTSKT